MDRVFGSIEMSKFIAQKFSVGCSQLQNQSGEEYRIHLDPVTKILEQEVAESMPNNSGTSN